tara:strand:+ start:126 stop:416 length:291 start_codon:yes stop_codon:yes gene_type:complete
MNYYVAPTSSIDIVKEKSHGMAEVTITLMPTGPVIETVQPNYISGVSDLSSGKKNPGMSYCEIQEKSPTITDDWIFISDSVPNQLTLNLITNINQI